jgi:hypothetical protein
LRHVPGNQSSYTLLFHFFFEWQPTVEDSETLVKAAGATFLLWVWGLLSTKRLIFRITWSTSGGGSFRCERSAIVWITLEMEQALEFVRVFLEQQTTSGIPAIKG